MTKIQTNYRPDIDGLRGVAVLAVVLHHLSAPLMPGGYVGVDVFFVISGYLITRIIRLEIEKKTFIFTSFYERRARRIFPALFAVLLTTMVASYFILLPSDMLATMRGALGTLFFVSNVVFWRDMAGGYFAATDAGLYPLLHTWSLSVEEQFYVFFPILLMICNRYFRKHIVVILVILGLLSLAAAVLLVQSKSVAVFFLSPFRAWELLVGALIAYHAVPPIRSRAMREFAAGVGLLAILLTSFTYDAKTTFPGLAALVPVLSAAAILHAGASGPTFTSRLLQWRPLIYIGLISYSLYLWHWPLMVLVRYSLGMGPITAYVPWLLLGSLALASLSYHFIEQPFRRGQAFSRRFIIASSALCIAVLSLVSGVGIKQEGFVERFTSEIVQLDKARSPQIPFVNCENFSLDRGCHLGSAEGMTNMLLWGDSHLLGWAPVLDVTLTKLNTRALFAYTSACPPILEVNNAIKAICPSRNNAVKDYLLANPNVKTVVMSAYWSTYFREDGPLSKLTGNTTAHGTQVAQGALLSTIQWLRDNGRQVVLIGPVPVHEHSVPMALALAKVTNRKLIDSTFDEQHLKHSPFFKVVESIKRGDGMQFSFLDPIQWMCAKNCVVMKAGTALYRDSHHLSIAGAMSLEDELSRELAVLIPNLGKGMTLESHWEEDRNAK
jgi:peptidoglycan/LPS O-acetylase OafA/YrhL